MGCWGSREAKGEGAALIAPSGAPAPAGDSPAEGGSPSDAGAALLSTPPPLPHTPCAAAAEAAQPDGALAERGDQDGAEAPAEPEGQGRGAAALAEAQPPAAEPADQEREAAAALGAHVAAELAAVPRAQPPAGSVVEPEGPQATGAPEEPPPEGAAAAPLDPWETLIQAGAVRPELPWHAAAAADSDQTLAWHLAQADSRSGCLEARGEDRATALHAAARAGAVGACRYLLLQGADPCAQDRERCSPLHLAALGGHFAACELLLEPGVLWSPGDLSDGSVPSPPENWPGVTTTDLWRRTPLHKASESGNLEVIRLLVSRKAQVEKSDREGNSALHKAAAIGHEAAVTELLRHPRVQADMANGDGNSALDLCVQGRHCGAGDALVAARAKLAKDARKKAPTLLDAALTGLPFLCTYVLSNDVGIGAASVKRQLQSADDNGRTAALVAARGGVVELLRRLVEGRADPAEVAPCGWAPLHEAAAAGQQDVAAWLLERRADIAAADAQGRTAVFHAAEGGHAEMLEWLTERGLAHDAQDGCERTPLHAAASSGHRAACEALLVGLGEAEALELVGAQDWEGASAAHLAMRAGHAETCALLARQRADLRRALDFGVTPLQIAAELGHGGVLELLLASLDSEGRDAVAAAVSATRVSDGRCAWLLAAAEGHAAVAARLWEAAGGPALGRAADRDGRDALLLAARGGHSELCRWLLDVRAGPSGVAVADACSWTPLHIAAAEGHKAVVRLLLDARADVAAVDVDGKSAREWAAARRHLAVEAALRDAEKAAASA